MSFLSMHGRENEHPDAVLTATRTISPSNLPAISKMQNSVKKGRSGIEFFRLEYQHCAWSKVTASCDLVEVLEIHNFLKPYTQIQIIVIGWLALNHCSKFGMHKTNHYLKAQSLFFLGKKKNTTWSPLYHSCCHGRTSAKQHTNNQDGKEFASTNAT